MNVNTLTKAEVKQVNKQHSKKCGCSPDRTCRPCLARAVKALTRRSR